MPGLGEGLKFKYEPILEQAPLDMKFHYYEEKEDGTKELKINTEGFKLIKSIEELKPYIDLCKDKLVAWDTETTGLTYDDDNIVGFSLSLSDMTGIYVPIRHKITVVTKQKTEKKDENGNIVLTKSGKPSTKTIETKEYFDCDENLDPKEALDILYEILINAKLVIAHNSEFDLNMLKFEGYDVNKINCFDTLILPYLYDPEGSGMAGLKALEKRLLGRIVPEFKDVLGKDCENFGCVKPSDGYVYTICDTSGLYGVFKKLYPLVKDLLKQHKTPLVVDGKPYNVLASDNKMVKAFVDYYGHANILIDREKAIKYEQQLEHRQTQVIKAIFDYFGRGPFNLSTSSNEFKEVMESKHVLTGVVTDKGAPSWGKKAAEEMRRNLVKLKESMLSWKEITFEKNVLSKTGKGFILSQLLEIYGDEFFEMKVDKNKITFKGKKGEPVDKKYFWLHVKEIYEKNMERYNILQLIQENNSLNKALNSYVDKLTQVDECKMHYRLKGTKSGRLSSGNGSKSDKRKNHYYIDLNAQNLTKPKSGYYSAEECDINDPEGVLGWKFTPLEKEYAMEHLEDMYIVEGQDPEITIRGCLKAPEGRYVVSLDYDAEELKVQCVISGDSKVKENFMKGIDPHEATAVGIWGAENYDKGKRKKAKACIGDNVLLLTNNGYKTATELNHETDRLIDMNGNLQEWVKTTDFGDLITLTFNNGISESFTPDHRIKVWNGKEIIWKEVKDLTKDDEIVQYLGNYNNQGKISKVLDYSNKVIRKNISSEYSFDICSNEFAYLAGLYLGDGSLIKYPKSRIHLTGLPWGVQYCVEPDSLDKVLSYLNKLGLKTSEPKLAGKNKKIYSIKVYNVAWASLINDYLGQAKTKYLNNSFYQDWNKKQFEYFVAGLLDSDGTIREGYYAFSSTNKEIIKALCVSCAVVGIKIGTSTRYAKYKGEKYPWIEAVLWELPVSTRLPILNESKNKINNFGLSRLGYWLFDKEFARELRSKHKNFGYTYKDKYYTTLNNVVQGKSKLTTNVRDLILEHFPDFPIQRNMNCLHIVSKEYTRGSINIIQTSNKVYSTVSTGSHNCNFLMAYLGSAPTLAEYINCPLEEAEDIIDKYKKAFPETEIWKMRSIEEMYNNGGVVFSAFGRPRSFKGWLNIISTHMDDYETLEEKMSLEKNSNRVKNAIERRTVNHKIQSTCGDILRVVMLRLYEKYFKNRDPHIDFLSTVHDEINYTIDKEVTVDYVRELEQLMTFDALDKSLPITTSTDIGYTYGNMFPFVWEDEKKLKLIPKRIHHV